MTSVTTSDRRIHGLTRREYEILQLLVHGKTSDEIASELYIQYGTVKTHIRNILQTLHARNRAQLVAMAYQQGLVAEVQELREERDRLARENEELRRELAKLL